MGLHIFDNFSELLSENLGDKGTSHIKPLLSIVITIILGSSTKSSLNESISHVSSEECFFELVTRLDANVRKEVVL